MKYLLNFILVLNALSWTVLAQAPPPPPPLIYQAPEKSDLKELVSEDKSFQITFPGIAKITKQEIPNGMVTTYRVYRQGSNSIVNTIDYNFELENQKEKIYEIIRNNLIKVPKTTIEAEREVKIGEAAGKEFDVLQDYQYQKVRILIVGRRVYEIKSDVTNWHILSKYNKEKVLDFQNETERFFSSFKSIKSPENTVIPLPSNFFGTATETSYKNTFFDFSLEFPKDWHQLNKTEIDASRNVGLESLKTDKEKVNRAFEDSTKKEVSLFVISQLNDSKGQNPNFGIGAVRQINKQVTAEIVADATKNFFLTNPKITLLKDIQKIKLNGTEFSTFIIQTDINGITLNQKLFITMRKGYSITFLLTSFGDKGRDKLENIMDSLRFGIGQ